MSSRDIKNIEASVHDRLLSKAKSEHRPFNELLQYFAMERFLCRLSRSQYSDKFILKGGLMLRAWEVFFERPTMDIDLLGQMENKADSVAIAIKDICGIEVEPDGLRFDADTLRAERIIEDAHYEGLRIRMPVYLGPSHVTLQLDIGFGDLVVPAPESIHYPTILEFPAPHLLGYSKESTVAEKLEAMVSLGMLNSRMKDYYDLWYLSKQFDFDGIQLSTAIQTTFNHRGTAVPANPLVLSHEFTEDGQKGRQWNAFLKRSRLVDVPDNLDVVLERLRVFLLPVLTSVIYNQTFSSFWKASGRWSE